MRRGLIAALRAHKAAGVPAVVWDRSLMKTVWISPEDLPDFLEDSMETETNGQKPAVPTLVCEGGKMKRCRFLQLRGVYENTIIRIRRQAFGIRVARDCHTYVSVRKHASGSDIRVGESSG